MSEQYGSDNKSALQAKFDAQKIAFAPIMFQAAKALRDFGILEFIRNKRKEGASVTEIAQSVKLSEYGVKVLVEAGLSLEMLMRTDDKYFLTKTGYFIMSDTLTRVNMDFTNDVNYLGMFHLQEAIKNGKPEGLKVFGDWPTIYEGLSQLPEEVKKSWFAFDHYYSDVAFPEIFPIIFKENPKKILDVGGNTGKFSIECAHYNPDVYVTIVDLPGQTSVAEKNIKEAGISERIDTYPVNLLDTKQPLPKEYDIIWMSQFLDCFSQEEILTLLTRAKEALSPGGALFILETYWDKQEYPASTYSLHATSLYFTAMANGNSQMYHSQDMINLIEKSGLKTDKVHENIGVSHTLIKCTL